MVQFLLKLLLKKSFKRVILARFLLYSYARRRINDLFVTRRSLRHQTQNHKEPLSRFVSLERSGPHLRFLDLLNSNKQLFWKLRWQQVQPFCMEPHATSCLARTAKFSWDTVTRNIYFAYQIIGDTSRFLSIYKPFN